ncbi:MAG: TIGR00159 family protein [Lachnospiraceae bacterium]|jgi:diadenylate cyclase|nr:TIGR00159 family protein [Lachnospiraceae bacterium]
MSQLLNFAGVYLNRFHMPTIRWTDILEIIILSFLVYQIILWIKNTRAWSLLRGIVIIMAFILAAAFLNMTTILWIAEKMLSLVVIATVVVLQPELRRALEQLGRTNFFASLVPFDSTRDMGGRFSDKTMQEIIKACYEMGKVRTGALIVVEQNQSLSEYERTGIEVDAILTSQLLINIFEHNTPLHDGAVIVRENRVVSATCYLPLSDNMGLSKELGTRHRAGVGISEVTDSLTIIVSEETGHISVAYEGTLSRDLDSEDLKGKLLMIQNKPLEEKKRRLWKGRAKNEKETDR